LIAGFRACLKLCWAMAKPVSPRSSPSFPRKPFEVCPLQTQDGESRRLCWTFCRVAAVLGFSRSRQAVLLVGERMIQCRFCWINLSICSLWRTWWCRMAFCTDGTSSTAAAVGGPVRPCSC
jgi:hypothetical protein